MGDIGSAVAIEIAQREAVRRALSVVDIDHHQCRGLITDDEIQIASTVEVTDTDIGRILGGVLEVSTRVNPGKAA